MPRLLLALLLAASLPAHADEDPRIDNALAISDALFARTIRQQEQHFLDKVNQVAERYIAATGSTRSRQEISAGAARYFDAYGQRLRAYYPFYQGLTPGQQHEVLKFLASPAGKAFLAAAAQAGGDLADSTAGLTPEDYFRALYAAEFDPALKAPPAIPTNAPAP